MPNVTRLLVENACYHVMTRGNQKQKVFLCDADYGAYLAILKKAKKKYRVLVYAYCLMPNHVLILVYLKVICDISKFMHWLNRGYTYYFNAKYEKVGHLWQGRFKSKPIIKDDYLLNCSEYIESNPVRAELVGDISKYAWSSYKERCLSGKKYILDDMLF